MNAFQIFIGVSIVVLSLVALLFFVTGKNCKESRLTPLAGLFFGENRLPGYSLLGMGGCWRWWISSAR